jgi:O-succinylbenzoate synthase
MPTSFAIKQAKLFAYQLPFASPLSFNGQKLSAREGLILQLQNNSGNCSFGEIAPLPGFSAESLEQAKTQVISLLNSGLGNLQLKDAYCPSVQFALACALHDIPLTSGMNNLDTVPLLQGDNGSVIRQYLALNRPSLIKLKVARQAPHKDLLLFKQLGKLNPHLQIRCDANQAWSVAEADYFMAHIEQEIVDYIEEPTGSYRANLQLAEKHQIGLALDETLQDRNFNYQHHACIKALVLKPTLIGSLSRLENFIDIAVQEQLSVHISSSFESIIGLQQLNYLANSYMKKCPLSLGIDTLKYFQPGLLTDSKRIKADLQKLECIWSSN